MVIQVSPYELEAPTTRLSPTWITMPSRDSSQSSAYTVGWSVSGSMFPPATLGA